MICNYADDNHLVNESNCIDTLKDSIEKDARRPISWFDNNCMDAYPDTFQFISLGRFGWPDIYDIYLGGGNATPPSASIKLLGVTLNSSLQYDTHISKLGSKAPNQIAVSLRTNPLFHAIIHIVQCPRCFVVN